MATERLLSPTALAPEEEQINWSLRPTHIDEYVGQSDLIERLKIAIEASKGRGEPMEHILLHGPPGLGKTTLAHVIAAEMGSRVQATSGPVLARATDLVAALTRLQHGDVLFIDEIHRLPVAVEEFIYPAMEDFRIDVPIDTGLNARTVQLKIKPFTLIGATTRAGLLSSPLRSRFGITHHLRYYSVEELLIILRRSASLLNMTVDDGPVGRPFRLPSDAAQATHGQPGKDAPPDASPKVAPPDASRSPLEIIAARSRGTPRIANRLLRRVRDFAQVRAGGQVDQRVVTDALDLESVDALGLDKLDRMYLRTILTVYEGGPVGLEAVAATLNEDAGTLEDVVEPYLLQIGFLARTRRGRMMTRAGAEHLGVKWAPREGASDDGALFRP